MFNGLRRMVTNKSEDPQSHGAGDVTPDLLTPSVIRSTKKIKAEGFSAKKKFVYFRHLDLQYTFVIIM